MNKLKDLISIRIKCNVILGILALEITSSTGTKLRMLLYLAKIRNKEHTDGILNLMFGWQSSYYFILSSL